MCASGDSTLCSPVDTPTNGKGAGEGGGSGKSNTVTVKTAQVRTKQLQNTVLFYTHTKETLLVQESYIRWWV